jgi:hypothetical protein
LYAWKMSFGPNVTWKEKREIVSSADVAPKGSKTTYVPGGELLFVQMDLRLVFETRLL